MLHILCFLFALAFYNLPIRSFSFFSRTVYRPFDLVFNMVFKVISNPASLFGCKMQPIEPLCKSVCLHTCLTQTHTKYIYTIYIYMVQKSQILLGSQKVAICSLRTVCSFFTLNQASHSVCVEGLTKQVA